MEKYSDQYKDVSIDNFPQLLGFYKTLAEFAYEGVRSVMLPDNNVGFCCEFEVDAGTSSLLYLREPIIIEVSISAQHDEVPIAYPDRKDFPYDKFPHENYPQQGMPPSLCLTREDDKEWYAEISFRQYVKTLINWLNDAANDRLIKVESGDQYEPFRIPNNVRWKLLRMFDFDKRIENSVKNLSLYFDTKLFEDSEVGNLCAFDPSYESDGLAIILSKPNVVVEKYWYIETPSTIADLFAILSARNYKLDVDNLRETLCKYQQIKRLFVYFSVLRPSQVIGKHSRVDSICYTMDADAIRNRNNDANVEPVAIIDLITPQFAAWLSKTSDDCLNKSVLIIGQGAVGSEITDLLYRSGIFQLTLCDNDIFNPHNVCRHIISEGSNFAKKAELMRDHLKEIYLCVDNVEIITEDIVKYTKTNSLNHFDLIIDSSASSRVMYALDELDLRIPIIRVCLSNEGKVGMVYVRREGDAKLQEFYYQILRESLNIEEQVSKDIASWLMSDRDSTLDRIRIGEGCHSITMQMGYNKVVAHCSLAVSIIKNNIFNENNLYLSFSDYDYEGSMYTERFIVPKYINIISNKEDWNVRIPDDLMNQIKIETKMRNKNETGGYVLGLVNEKRRTIHILTTFIPTDSRRSHYSLTLGTKGWKEYYEMCKKQTANQVVYLGDWHSHPYGSVERSKTDEDTFAKIRPEIDGIGVCLITNGNNHKAYILD